MAEVTSIGEGSGRHSGRRLTARTVPVVRVAATNESATSALAHLGWNPLVFIGVCDGCTMGSHCQNDLLWRDSMPNRLKPRYWVTDHFQSAAGGRDPSDGDVIEATDHVGPVLRQVRFLSTSFRNYVAHRGALPQPEHRLRGGSRLFEVLRHGHWELTAG